MNRRKAGIVITDGVGFRNFILSDFPTQLKKRFDTIHIYSCLPKDVYTGYLTEEFSVHELGIFREPLKSWFFRKIKEVAHLMAHQDKNFGIQDNLSINRTKQFTPKGILTRLAFLLSGLFHSEKWILRWEKWQYATFRNHPLTKEYRKLLQDNKPEFLFFTHQRPPFISPMLEAARQEGIPVSAFIFSWDNLPSKGRMCGTFDTYIVWSNLMKEELLDFYPSIQSEQIHVGGTPQFEPYVMDTYATTRELFLSRFELNATKPVVCYSCGDSATSRNDELYISVLAESIKHNLFGREVQLLVRTSPAEGTDRFAELKRVYPFIVWNYPKWIYARENHPEPWTQRIPTREDIQDLRAILEYSDVNINMCSTMSLDFMQFDKPVINPVFGNAENGLYNDQRFLKYAHYQRVAESGAVAIVKNKEELIAAINNALVHPQNASAERKKLLELQIGRPLKGTSEAIVEVLSKTRQVE
jgi:hypothetical protein